MRIHNDKGECLEGSKIADEFVNHFDKFLGQSYLVSQLDTLGDIFSSSLTNNEAEDMVRDATDLEIKNAMFGIGDSKAPGPDGYTTCFFKKAWPIIGNEVCSTIKEFFMTGMILNEINSTLIALIPKIPNPKLVTEFRPIACCNVIYKCISKILTNRIKDSLNKLVNLNQSAFIKGRIIQDNIMLTQELLKGYTRKGGSKRCALKIDIAKAYDTRSWLLLGGRVLRQGNLISPYLFTLVMEVFSLIVAHKIRLSSQFRYHIGCKDLMLTHLCFADDLIVLCHGDKSSISIIKEALEDFSAVSRLKPNLSKSTIFFGNVNSGEQRSILKVLPFKVGSFPAKYIRVPLVTKRLSREDWSMQIYWASVFLLPKSIMKDIESVLKGFLWCQGDLAREKAKIAWKTLCKPKCQESLWVKWVHMIKLKDRSFGEVNPESSDSWMWKVFLGLRDKAIKYIEIKVGDQKKTSVWYDKWNDVGPLCQWVWQNKWSTSFPDLIAMHVPLLNDKQEKAVWRCNDGSVRNFSKRQTCLITDLIALKWPEKTWCGSLSVFISIHLYYGWLFWYAEEVWYAIKDKGYLKNFKREWVDTVSYMAMGHGRNIKSVVSRVVFRVVVYYIWQERNKRCSTQEKRSVKTLCNIILDIVRMRLISLKVKDSANVKEVAKD
ncbi:RNA-directed DNA polymerase, eukaryota, reverse transcriptase zinc-binding domain protein [Tanacetum coccineum]